MTWVRHIPRYGSSRPLDGISMALGVRGSGTRRIVIGLSSQVISEIGWPLDSQLGISLGAGKDAALLRLDPVDGKDGWKLVRPEKSRRTVGRHTVTFGAWKGLPNESQPAQRCTYRVLPNQVLEIDLPKWACRGGDNQDAAGYRADTVATSWRASERVEGPQRKPTQAAQPAQPAQPAPSAFGSQFKDVPEAVNESPRGVRHDPKGLVSDEIKDKVAAALDRLRHPSVIVTLSEEAGVSVLDARLACKILRGEGKVRITGDGRGTRYMAAPQAASETA